VYLRFSAREIDKCRAFLGLSSQGELFEQTRKARRADCDLPLRFVSPALEPTGSVRNISETGIRAIFPLPFHRGQRMRVAMQLERGQELETSIEISWTKRNETTVGAKFLDLSPSDLERIENAIDRFLSARRQRSTKLILAADSDPKILEFLQRELGQQGFEVRTVHRGDEALSLARQLRPELIILEALLPGVDGVDICTFLRADAEMADLPILMTSELDGEALHRMADFGGATNYLTKPIDLVELFRSIADCLSPRSEA
jgi:CheY-like chemotaxis protein